jgi:hypothetical protein
MNIIFQINGGIGKCIAATAVCEGIKKKYPDQKLIIVSGYPEVFLNNPNVDRSFAFGQMNYFYEEYILNTDSEIFAHDPYLVSKHIYSKEHLIESWFKLYDLPYNLELPKIYLTEREIDFFSSKYASEKPLFVIHSNGGGQTDSKYSWARDLPSALVLSVINEFKKDYNIVHIKREDQIGYPETFPVTDNFRSLCVLIMKSNKRLLIDSFAQHAAAALLKPSSVCWIANKPNVFGYQIHDNITSNNFTRKPELKFSYFNQFNIGGEPMEFPYTSESEIFDLSKIVNSIKLQ